MVIFLNSDDSERENMNTGNCFKLHQFPFDRVNRGSNVILYGGGVVGREYLQQAVAANWCNILFIVDKNRQGDIIEHYESVPVRNPDAILKSSYDHIVISVGEEFLGSVLSDIAQMRLPPDKVVHPGKVIDGYMGDSAVSSPQDRDFYSSNGEDLLILGLFRILKIDKPGYMDVGAHDPYRISNTALFYKHGCRGVNIEVNPNLIQAFYRERPDDISLNVGVGAKNETRTFYMFAEKSSNNTFSPESVERVRARLPERGIQETREMAVVTLPWIVKEYLHGEYPHFLNIDIEGLEYEVLASCDFEAGKNPLVICVETRSGNMGKMSSLLFDKGFSPYCRMRGNFIYIRNELRKEIFPRFDAAIGM